MAKSARQTAGELIVRVYAFAIMAVVVWAGYTAVKYLYRTVFQPAKAPPALLAWQAETTAAALRQPDARGITEPAPRPPMGHYHGVDRWFQPDVRNGCAAAGCHEPIPHSRNKAVRAFANLHATFMTCNACHSAPSATPMPVVWTSIRTGERQGPPAILQLLGHLGSYQGTADAATQPAATTRPAQDLASFSATTVQLLREAVDTIGGDAVLNYLLVQLQTSEPGSPVWRRAIDQLRSDLPNHARGEYGAKITPATPAPALQPIRQDFGPLAEEYRRSSDPGRRAEIHKQVHEGVVAAPQGCTPCHQGKPPLLDFAALGYPPQRIHDLTGTRIVGFMTQIRSGHPVNLPLSP